MILLILVCNQPLPRELPCLKWFGAYFCNIERMLPPSQARMTLVSSFKRISILQQRHSARVYVWELRKAQNNGSQINWLICFNSGRLCNVRFGGIVLHNNFIGLCWNFDIVWTSQVNDLWNICSGSGESDRIPIKCEVTLYPNYSFVI